MRGCIPHIHTLISLPRWYPLAVGRTVLLFPHSFSTFTVPRCRRAEHWGLRSSLRRLYSDLSKERPGAQDVIRPLQSLPFSCPGCGALTQPVEAEEAGFYSPNRKSVKAWLHHDNSTTSSTALNPAVEEIDASLENVEAVPQGVLGQQNGDREEVKEHSQVPPVRPPICDRCHNLLHYSQARPIFHPEIDSIADTLAESPYKHNHIYHVLDAADFPLSLVRDIYHHLDIVHQRSRNRRAKNTMFRGGHTNTVSFIVTRSDLLAPQKEQIDTLMPYVTDVLRTALGKAGEGARMGNVHLVSAKRGWWTTGIKEDIWKRGGGNWMVGKVNVGKSNLFEVVFPKGRNETVSYDKLRQVVAEAREDKVEPTVDDKINALLRLRDEGGTSPETKKSAQAKHDIGTLLPPLQPEMQYPVMPLVSSLPGTTASPIRLSFGKGQGELIDLPGLSRGKLEHYVADEHKADLVMETRPKPEQLVMKPGQSLLLGGGLIRITPVNAEDVILAYAFTPIKPHITSTQKATETQLQQRESGIESITKEGAGEAIKSAGIFWLDSDVTKQRSRKLIAAGRSLESLPFRIFATDILIEGVGWVELATQVRKRRLERAKDEPEELVLPRVEVFSPEGKSIGSRRSMCGWVLSNKARSPGPPARPRRSMKGAKKAAKLAKRQAKLSTQTEIES